MKARRHHPRLSRLLSSYFDGPSQAQAIISLYLLRGGWPLEDWIAYRRRMADILSMILPKRHAVLRHQRLQERRSALTPTLPLAPEGSGLTEALRASGEST